MKFSDDTMMVLKNFAEINPSLLFKEGSILTTLAPTKQVMAKAKLKDSFPSRAGVYDLSRFLATVSLFDDPNIDFGSDKFDISSNKSHGSYTYAAENMIITPPQDELEVDGVVAEVEVSNDVLRNVVRAAGVLGLPHIRFMHDGKTLSISATDVKNPNSDTYQEDLTPNQPTYDEFDITVNVENLRLLPGNYSVTISTQGIVHFRGDVVEYWIAANSN